jgi:hypothetical protein
MKLVVVFDTSVLFCRPSNNFEESALSPLRN